jgi:DNA mismatch repair ATPase MutS
MHDRRVARIITPGTLIDENFMDPYANNYVMAVHLPEIDSGASGDATISDVEGQRHLAASDKLDVNLPSNDAAAPSVGVAWLDLSTGHFVTQATTLASLGSVFSRVAPREIVLDKELQFQQDHDVFSILAEDKHLITYSSQGDELQKLSDWEPMLEAEIPEHIAASFTEDELRAGSLLLRYVQDRLRGMSMKLQPPQRHESMQIMTIDKNSMRSLEIKQTIRDSLFRGSLLHAIRRTVTKSGARLLNEWLSKLTMPLLSHA